MRERSFLNLAGFSLACHMNGGRKKTGAPHSFDRIFQHKYFPFYPLGEHGYRQKIKLISKNWAGEWAEGIEKDWDWDWRTDLLCSMELGERTGKTRNGVNLGKLSSVVDGGTIHSQIHRQTGQSAPKISLAFSLFFSRNQSKQGRKERKTQLALGHQALHRTAPHHGTALHYLVFFQSSRGSDAQNKNLSFRSWRFFFHFFFFLSSTQLGSGVVVKSASLFFSSSSFSSSSSFFQVQSVSAQARSLFFCLSVCRCIRGSLWFSSNQLSRPSVGLAGSPKERGRERERSQTTVPTSNGLETSYRRDSMASVSDGPLANGISPPLDQVRRKAGKFEIDMIQSTPLIRILRISRP